MLPLLNKFNTQETPELVETVPTDVCSMSIVTSSPPSQRSLYHQTKSIPPMMELASDFVPGPYDVICGRGKQARNHPGNKRYQSILAKFVGKYSQATTKLEKSIVVSEIVEFVRCGSPDGGFVRQKSAGGVYCEVGDEAAREKVGSGLRDLLHHQYKSSSKAKWRKHLDQTATTTTQIDTIVQSNEQIRLRTERLQSDVAATCPTFHRKHDAELLRIFTQANMDMLFAIKTDTTLCPKE